MQFIPTRVHGIIDYLTGAVLILAPWLFGFADGGPAQWVPVVLGVAIIVYSLVTDYELAAATLIPVPVHLMLDVGGGLLLLVSPWLFGFSQIVVWPHMLVGAMEIVIAALTERRRRHAAGT